MRYKISVYFMYGDADNYNDKISIFDDKVELLNDKLKG